MRGSFQAHRGQAGLLQGMLCKEEEILILWTQGIERDSGLFIFSGLNSFLSNESKD
jgi:hypothetical protein